MTDAPSILILSDDADFTAVIAEQVKQQLQCNPLIVKNKEEAEPLLPTVALIIADAPCEAPCPVLLPEHKPFRLPELLQQAVSLLHKRAEHDTLALGGAYSLRLKYKQLLHEASGRSVDLTDKEAQLLQTLAEAEGTVAKEQLLKIVWGIETPMDTHTLETHIYRLRGKLRELADDELITAVEGGYRLEE